VREALTRPSFVYAVPGRDGDDRVYLVRHGRVLGEARCNDLEAMAALHARTRESTSTLHAAPADQLDEVLMIEQWFRARPAELARTAATMVDALQHLVTDAANESHSVTPSDSHDL
jgi:excinuclease ABC subunit C